MNTKLHNRSTNVV